MGKLHTVYQIIYHPTLNTTYRGEVIYYGRTNDLKRRQYEHNYRYKMGKKKQLYDFLREQGFPNDRKIYLKPLKTFKKKVEAKRYEAYLLLHHHFYGEYPLQQKLPAISDRF